MIEVLPWRDPAMEGRPDAKSRHAATTPGRLRLLSVLIVGGAGLIGLAASSALIGGQRSVDGVGRQTVPAIVGAQRMHAAFADADRAAANAYLLGDVETARPRQDYERSLNTATAELEQTAEHNGTGAEARQSTQEINQRVTQYAGLVETARANNRQGFPVGVAYLRQASDLMHDSRSGILAKVDRLADLNSNRLADEDAALWVTVASLGAFLTLALVLLVTLLRTQRFLRRRFRRRHNLRLMGATTLLLLLAGWMGFQAFTTYTNLRIAESEAFVGMHALYQTRSVVDDLNGNTSLALIAPSSAASLDDTFRLEASQLVDRQLTDGLVDAAAQGHVQFEGLFADELRSNFPGERDAVAKALRAYQQYLKIDAAVRAQAPSDHQGAVTLALGTDRNQLAGAFKQVDDALVAAIAIDQQRFDEGIAKADPGMTLNVGIPLLVLGIGALALWGLQPRLAEYRA